MNPIVFWATFAGIIFILWKTGLLGMFYRFINKRVALSFLIFIDNNISASRAIFISLCVCAFHEVEIIREGQALVYCTTWNRNVYPLNFTEGLKVALGFATTKKVDLINGRHIVKSVDLFAAS